jgi:hypothetical protein
MPQIIKPSLVLALLLLAFLGLLTIAGCGDENSQSHYDPEQGRHPADWVPDGHVDQALQHLDTCATCHGSQFDSGQNAALTGGISKVPCSECHTVGHTATGNASVHPLDWDGFVYARHADYVRQRGTAFCASTFCHGTNLQGGNGPSCTACHIGDATHVHPWATEQQDLATTPSPLHAQYVFTHGDTTASCRNAVCHGTNLQGVLLSGPPCSACHGAAASNFPQ